jgi:UDPglucose 6-dehydrogenase
MTSLKITVIGTGYVGLVTGVCLSSLGFQVHCVDVNPDIIATLQSRRIPFFEPGLQDLLIQGVDQGRLHFSTEMACVEDADLIFIAVGTPSSETGEANLSYVRNSVTDLASRVKEGAIVVIKSTVPIGTNRDLQDTLQRLSGKKIHVVSNPEFLREGAALQDFMSPDRIVIGSMDPGAEGTMHRLYRFFSERGVPFLFASPETAELIKYASNSFLALKIGFINELSDLCERLNADVMDVAQGMGLDQRIGKDFLNPGPGYGGSCFPKDTLALAHMADAHQVPLTLLKTLIQSNETRKQNIAQKIIEACGGSVRGKTLGILGITFKAETDDMRDSPSLVILPLLEAAGAKLTIYDPQGMEAGKRYFEEASWGTSPLQVAHVADALIILTEWKEFGSLDLETIAREMKTPLLIDMRNLYKPRMIPSALTYVSLGRGA